jgi:membrane complex biogenesis BtpA family protein
MEVGVGNRPSLGWLAGGCKLIGMVHALPLPGSPGWGGSLREVRARAAADAEALAAGGCDALLLENMHDLPYLRGRVEPETVAALAVIADDLRRWSLPVGLQVLAAANREALGIAAAVGLQFIRVEGFAWAHVADEGWIDACAGELLRARRALGADVAVVADVQKKHAAHAVTADLSLGELARGTAFCGADAVVITGRSTGEPTDASQVAEAREAGVPVWVGSGVTPADARSLASVADALIVGSNLKFDGDWRRGVDPARVEAVRRAMAAPG